MNLLFLTMSKMTSISQRGIYTDLMRKFKKEGHTIFIVSPSERRDDESTRLIDADGVKILLVRTLNVQKTNVIEKGLGQVSIEHLYKKAIKKYFYQVSFDLILYSTPPITLAGVVDYLKQRNPQVVSYLLLKDIFPQNAVDIGMMTTKGIKGLLYKRFRKQEIALYKLSDYIGCMSPANVEYLLKHNPYLCSDRVEVAPNSIELVPKEGMGVTNRSAIKEKYGLPTKKPIFIYGGNLGKPQGIPFLIECLRSNLHREDCHFLIVGSGTYLPHLLEWYKKNRGGCVTVLNGLPKDEYDQLVQVCDVGLIFLDYRFSIPNYPSRLLSYLEYKMPIIATTDPNCDTGSIAERNGYGYWCESNDVNAFTSTIDKMLASDIKAMGEKGYEFLCKHYLVEHTYWAVANHLQRMSDKKV